MAIRGPGRSELSRNFVGHDLEPGEGRRPIAGGERHIGGVATAADQYAAYALAIVARVESVPMPAEIGFEPGAEIHRRVGRRYADVAEVAGAVSGRNV